MNFDSTVAPDDMMRQFIATHGPRFGLKSVQAQLEDVFKAISKLSQWKERKFRLPYELSKEAIAVMKRHGLIIEEPEVIHGGSWWLEEYEFTFRRPEDQQDDDDDDDDDGDSETDTEIA